ncbi:MAG: AbrB/MazE/SpoVT family DNA-binding domain-containing protein [Ornithinimicrobium sp.]
MRTTTSTVAGTSATVTSKGQITIPADVRARLGLRPGSRLAIVPTAGGYEIHPQPASIKDLKGAVPRPARDGAMRILRPR